MLLLELLLLHLLLLHLPQYLEQVCCWLGSLASPQAGAGLSILSPVTGLLAAAAAGEGSSGLPPDDAGTLGGSGLCRHFKIVRELWEGRGKDEEAEE